MNYPKGLRTHVLRLLGPKTILYRAFWAILSLRVKVCIFLSSRLLEGPKPKEYKYRYRSYLLDKGAPIVYLGFRG